MLFNLRVLNFPTIIPRIQKLNFQTSGIPQHPIFIPNSSIFYIRYISPFNHNISIHISCDNIPRQFNTDKEGVCALCRAWKIFQSVEKNANRGGGTVWTGLPARDAGASRRRRERRGREVAPKGLTRALKIENSKWPIFPADGTETKSRQPFIMTCIGVRAAVICTVSLQNSCRLIGPAWKNCVHPAKLRAHNFSPLDRGYIYPWD